MVEAKMKFKGMDILARHVPELNSTGGKARTALYAVFLLALVTAYFVVTDNIPTWSIDSEIIIVALGFLILSLFFSRKSSYKEKYKELAYRNAFAHYGMPGSALIIGAVAHAGYMNGPVIPTGWWTIIFFVAGWFMLCVGALLWIRGTFSIGADNLAMLYVYHPEEGKVINSGLYGILRHPIYAGVMRVAIGLTLLNGNGNSIVFAVFVPLGIISWIRLIEEKELIERFGQAYLEYRKSTPALWPKLGQLGAFYRFLILGR
jgi:protein-S-isoprenylcysteine O-methyltransferase Ste14